MALLPVLVLAGCADGSGQASSGSGAIDRPQDPDAVPVVVAKVERSSIPVELRAIGTGQAFKTVSVESQVAGIVQDVHYRQGQLVHKGDLLVTLDKRPFHAALSRAEAALARDKAQAQLGQAELERNDELAKKGSSPRTSTNSLWRPRPPPRPPCAPTRPPSRPPVSICPIARSTRRSAGSPVPSSSIPGATVKANDAPVLVVINQVSPIYVGFSVPQQYLEAIRTFMARSRCPSRPPRRAAALPRTAC